MGLPRSNDGEGAVFGLCGGAHERDRACGPGQAASRLLLGFDDALRAQKRGADGSDHSARTDRSPASVAAAFYRREQMSDEKVLVHWQINAGVDRSHDVPNHSFRHQESAIALVRRAGELSPLIDSSKFIFSSNKSVTRRRKREFSS